MKSKFTLLTISLITLVSILMFFSACQEDDPLPAEISSVLINTSPFKVEYFVGDVLDLSGLEVTIVMDNGDTQVIPFSEFKNKNITCKPENGTVLTKENTEVLFTHTESGKSISCSITVKELNVIDIVIKSSPLKVNYYESDTLDLTGLAATLHFNNGKTQDVSFEDFESSGIECNPKNGALLTMELNTVTVTHITSGKYFNQSITVSELKVIDLSISNPPLKTEYYEGDILDLTGIVITLHLNNNQSLDVNFDEFKNKGLTYFVMEEQSLTLESTVVTITHTNSKLSIEQEIVVHKKEVIKISIKTSPDKLDYYLGETIDLSGVVLTITYNSGESIDIALNEFAEYNITSIPENGGVINTRSVDVVFNHTVSGNSVTENISFFKVADIDGNNYHLVKINEQIWMAENLQTTTYNDGTAIVLETDNTTWNSLTTPAYCWYNNDQAANENIYGAMYNWYAVETDKLCPGGWHVPTDSEWLALLGYIENQSIRTGRALKSKNYYSNGIGYDLYGFTALPGGMRSPSWDFANQTSSGFYWTSDEYGVSNAITFCSSANSDDISRFDSEKVFGFSVRCIKD